jgi:Secretion system C-terminal sorting domain
LTSVAPPSLAGPGGPYSITWTARDAANNIRTCSYSVVVICGGPGLQEDIQSRTAPTQSSVGTVEISPNPSTGLFNLLLQGFEDQALVQIFDATGRNVWQMKVDAKQSTLLVDLSAANFDSGLYLVTVTNDGTVVTKRLILNK